MRATVACFLLASSAFAQSSDSAGVYTLPQLPAETYALTSITPGFMPLSQVNIQVSVSQRQELNLHFQDMQLNTLGDGRDCFASLATHHTVSTGPTPRMPDGKPDLSGVWYPQRIVDPGKPEMMPWAEAVFQRARRKLRQRVSAVPLSAAGPDS